MERFTLNGTWNMNGNGMNITGKIPGSVYSFLLDMGLMEDPYYRLNELSAIAYMKQDYVFSTSFPYHNTEKALLCFDGVDTVANIYLNGTLLGSTKNMHRKYEFNVTELLRKENELRVEFPSIYEIFQKLYQEENIFTEPCGPLAGAKNVRKSFSMSGWDWGPRLADMGIWKDVYLLDLTTPAIDDFEVLQYHTENGVFVRVDADVKYGADAEVNIELVSPNGETSYLKNHECVPIEQPMLWWPRGYGVQNLYTVTVSVAVHGTVCDRKTKRIGLRTMELVREPDEYGVSYYHRVNGQSVFAMGGCYIPEDVILSRITRERTEQLLDDCVFANYNTIRVWGGGHYPHDFFFDLCDEKGILVFEDMMYACSNVSVKKEHQEEFYAEVRENIKRIRHHACLAVLCGNNEMELWTHPDDIYGEIYLDVFEDKLPKIAAEVAPYLPYVYSSPTAIGGFRNTNDENIGDSHYWDIWAGEKPITDYRNHHFRYLSEFGLSSLPDEKTVNAFTLPEDRNLCSRVMEMHQRAIDGNNRLLWYITKTYRCPTTLSQTIYASQILHAEAVRIGTEHQRMHRGRCMGTLYWQVNDIWPVASGASLDYYGNYKALHYVARRCFASVMIGCLETGETTTRQSIIVQQELYDYATTAEIFVCNETDCDVNGTIRWQLKNHCNEVLQSGEQTVIVPAFDTYRMEKMDFCKTEVNQNFLSYSFIVDGKELSCGTTLFTEPKYFEFQNPEIEYEILGNQITLRSKAFAKSVAILSEEQVVLSDNYFDLCGEEKTVTILRGELKNIKIMSVYDIGSNQ